MIIPKKLEELIRKEAEKLNVSEDELILNAICEYLKLDADSRADIHFALSEKYLRDAEDLLKKKDFIQASEKAWGAASQVVKAVAVMRGKELRSYGELHKFVAELRREYGDVELSTLWASATSLHQNFYENWLSSETVKDLVANVKKFVEKLKAMGGVIDGNLSKAV